MTKEQEVLKRLIGALLRKDTEQDGSWGYMSFYDELRELEKLLGEEV